jgi:hypothetical protein
MNSAYGLQWGAPNVWSACLYGETELWREIMKLGGPSVFCCPAAKSDDLPPWVSMPPEGRRYQQIYAQVLPAVEQVDFLLGQFRVPDGYDAVIVSVVNLFTGGGFAEASGDIRWRIRINQRYLKDYGDIRTTIGSLTSPFALYRGGVRLKTQDLVQYWAQIGVGGLNNLAPAGRVVGAFFGWYYPTMR